MTTVIVKPAGQPVPKIEKRSAESILYTLDCAELLAEHELIVSIDMPNPKPGLIVASLRPRRGRVIEIRIENQNLSAQYVDFVIDLLFYTTFNNKKSAVFQLRAHK